MPLPGQHGSPRGPPDLLGAPLLRVDTPIFWVTAPPLLDAVVSQVDCTPGVRAVVLDLEATNQMDGTSFLSALGEILQVLRDRDRFIDLYLVRAMWRARRALSVWG